MLTNIPLEEDLISSSLFECKALSFHIRIVSPAGDAWLHAHCIVTITDISNSEVLQKCHLLEHIRVKSAALAAEPCHTQLKLLLHRSLVHDLVESLLKSLEDFSLRNSDHCGFCSEFQYTN